MAKSDLWQRLNREVSMASVKALITGDSTDEATSALDAQADEIIFHAAREAKQRGKPIEVVLAERGFNLPISAEARSKAAAAADTPQKNTPLEAPVPKISEAVIEELRQHLRPLSVADIAPLVQETRLESLSAKVVIDRLSLLYPEYEARARVAARGVGSVWQRLFSQGVPAAALADILRTDPLCLPLLSDGADFRAFLTQRGVISAAAAAQIVKTSADEDKPYLLVAQERGYLTGTALLNAAAEFTGLPKATGLGRKPSKAALADFPLPWARLLWVVPLRRNGAALVVAVPYAPSERLLTLLGERLGRKVQAHLAAPEEIDPLRAQLLGPDAPAGDAPKAPSAGTLIEVPVPASTVSPSRAPTPARTSTRAAGTPIAASASATSARPTSVDSANSPGKTSSSQLLFPELQKGSAVERVQQVLQFAIESRATDIHIEPADKGARIRFRIDGICHEALRLTGDEYLEFVARLKVMADLDVTERRRPQDGHIHTTILGSEHDLRVATVPARGGEKIGLRIANTGRISMRLDQLGLWQSELAVLRDIATLPFGMILATGPVGSGKTTTLYSCLSEVDRAQRHVMSIEDPIEFTLEGANHVEVNYALGLDFVQGLRALLRQDPDVILIGEIRDEETARISVRASMTGLMVYSTLHANDATGAVTAMRNFHIAPHLLASSFRGVVAQRLLRKICVHCKVKESISHADAVAMGFKELPEGMQAYRGAGCPACLFTGYTGRTGVFEIFRVDEHARNMILEEASERDIRAYVISQGMRTLQQDGLQKIADGVTSIEEFHRVLRF